MQEPALTLRGLERRIKRHLTSTDQSFAAITTPGFEPYTSREIAALDGAKIGIVENGIVEFSGQFELMYSANLTSRTASRILLRIGAFTVRSYPELYNKLRRIDWELYTGFAPEVAFTVTSTRSRLHHTDRIAETSFSALHDHLETLGVRVACTPTAAIRFFIRFIDDTCVVSIDTSGELLYKRGYRRATGRAPLRETAAAAILAAVEWEKYDVVADPCCGSGSVVLETLLQLNGIQPGNGREYAFFSWPSFSKPAWEHLKRRCGNMPTPDQHQPRLVYAGDVDPLAIERVKLNCAALPADTRLIVECADCMQFNYKGKFGRNGLVVSNLPYGKRIDVTEPGIKEFYALLGRALKKNCRGWDYAFLVADPQFESLAHLDGATVLSFANGGIRVRLVKGSVG